MLTLPIKKKWFDLIESGVKKEEYREIKPYYTSRFRNIDNPHSDRSVIRFRAGYSKASPLMECSVIIGRGTGREEWGAVPDVEYYVLEIKSVKRIK